MKITRSAGLVASVLTLLHGFYLAVILAGLVSFAPPVLNPIALAGLDTIVYLFLGVGMLRGRESYFVYAIFWTIWGALLATFAATYETSVLNLLSFLIVFSCVYYHVSVNRTNADVAKKLGQFAAVLAIIQGIIVTFAFAFAYIFHLKAWLILVPSPELTVLGSTFTVIVIVTAVVYLVSGVGMLKGKKEFFFLAIFWTIVEPALTLADSSYADTHINVISILILAFATYYYFRTPEA